MVFAWLFILILWISPGCRRLSDRAVGEWSGRIIIIGNEPFTHVACEDAAGHVYTLIAPDTLLQALRERQGQWIQIHGSLTTNRELPAIVAREVEFLNHTRKFPPESPQP